MGIRLFGLIALIQFLCIFSAFDTEAAPIAVTSGPKEIRVDQCAGPYKITRPGSLNVTRYIQGYAGAKLHSDSGCKNVLPNGNSIVFPAGVKTANFYLKDSQVESLSLTVTAKRVGTGSNPYLVSVTAVPQPSPTPTLPPTPTPTGTPGGCQAENADYYVAPDGNDNNDGSLQRPFKSLTKLWTVLSAGKLAYLRGGTYAYSTQQYLQGRNGTASSMIRVWAYPCETPVITRANGYPNSEQDLIYFEGEYIHFKGLEITSPPQKPGVVGWPSFRSGYSVGCIYEQINYHHNMSAFTIRGNSTGNLIVRSDFHHNADPYGWAGDGVDAYDGADGLDITYIGNEQPNNNYTNTIRECRAWYNADDGFDAWENWGQLTIENSWAFHNGYIEGTFNEAGNGSGFKLGAYSGGVSSKLIRTLRNNIAYQNRLWGFVENNAVAKHLIYNNTAVLNGGLNFWFGSWGESQATVRNNISHQGGSIFGSTTSTIFSNSSTVDHNSWDTPGVSVTDSDFVNLDPTQLLRPRKADGSLPDVDFLRLRPGSDLIDAGIGVGLPYNGGAPDIGAWEYSP